MKFEQFVHLKTHDTLHVEENLLLVKVNKVRVSVNLLRGSNYGYAASKLTLQEFTVHQVDNFSIICTSFEHVA